MFHTPKTCCFIGHRNATLSNQENDFLYSTIEDLIKKKVSIFLFGSKSNFDTICYKIVTQLKNKYLNIKRIIYTCKSETAFIESTSQEKNELLQKLNGAFYFEKIHKSDTDFKFRKNSYIERNKAMIKNSDYCVFYFNNDYLPINKNNENNQTKSGTALAFSYANKLNKKIINIYELKQSNI